MGSWPSQTSLLSTQAYVHDLGLTLSKLKSAPADYGVLHLVSS